MSVELGVLLSAIHPLNETRDNMKITVEFEVGIAPTTDEQKIREYFIEYLHHLGVIEEADCPSKHVAFWVKNGKLVEPEFEDSDLTGPVGKYWERCTVQWPARASEAGDLVKVGPPEVLNIHESGTEGLDDLLSSDWQIMN